MRLHEIHVADGSRVEHRRFCKAENREIPYAQVGRSFTLADGRTVPLTEDDLACLPLPTRRTLDTTASCWPDTGTVAIIAGSGVGSLYPGYMETVHAEGAGGGGGERGPLPGPGAHGVALIIDGRPTPLGAAFAEYRRIA